VTIDVHGSLDRAKDVSSLEEALVGRHFEECVRLAHADDVPLLILPEDTCCRRCVRRPGKRPQQKRTDRPRRAFFRPPAKADGILRIRVPFTVTTRVRRSSRDFSVSPPDTRAGPPLTPPTRFPHGWGQRAFGGHCKRPYRHYPAVTFGGQRAFTTSLRSAACDRGDPRGSSPGPDDPSE